MNADDCGSADLGLTVLVLMAVDDQFRLGPIDVVGQCVKALVNAVLAGEVCNYDTDVDAYQFLVFGGPRKRAQRRRTPARQARLRDPLLRLP